MGLESPHTPSRGVLPKALAERSQLAGAGGHLNL